MRARHVMVSPVKTGKADMTVRDVAKILTENHISALPIVDDAGNVIGIVSEGDLIRRAEIGTEAPRRSWLSFFAGNIELAQQYARSHATQVKDLMTRDIVAVVPDTPLSEIANLFESRNIKRVPVIEAGKLVGIVTRANLVQAIATAPQDERQMLSDEEVRRNIQNRLEAERWTNVTMLNVTVSGGVVHLWGLVRSEAERSAVRIAIEGTPGVRSVKDNLALEPLPAWI